MKIDSVIARQNVDDLEGALPFYERLTGRKAERFAFAGVHLASVGPFLLFSGPEEAVRRTASVSATLTSERRSPRDHGTACRRRE